MWPNLAESKFSLLAILIVIIAITWINFNTHPWNQRAVIKHDILGYYSYLPAALIYNDLSFQFIDDDPAFFGDKVYKHIAPNGGRYQKMTMGLSFLYLPFFLMGHLAAHLSGAEITGYSPPYMFFLQFSSLVYLLVGLFFLWRILAKYFSDWVIALVLLGLVFGTGVLFYGTFEAAMSHTYSFMLFAVFVRITIRWHEKQTICNTLWLGFTFGLITLIRPTNGLIIIFLVLYDVKTIDELGKRIVMLIKKWPLVLLMMFCTFLVFIPQLLFWKLNTGQWLFYTYGDESFFFLKPEITNGLFSYRKGWLLYTPLMVMALAGIAVLFSKQRKFFVPLLVFTILNIYVVYSWWCWWYGGGFGSRPMIDSYPLMAIPLAAFIAWASAKLWSRVLVITLAFLLGFFSIFQTIQYHYGSIHFDSMTKKAYWNSFGKVRPVHPFWDYLEAPDITLAMKGKEAVAPKSKQTFAAFLQCDYELLTDNGELFYSTDREFLLAGVAKRSDKKARSGRYSLCLHRDEQFGSDMQLKAEAGERYRLSVWKFPAGAPGGVAFTAPIESQFYNFTQLTSSRDEHGWGKVELEVILPDTLSGMMKIYIWNPGNDTVYFDDLSIEKIPRQQD